MPEPTRPPTIVHYIVDFSGETGPIFACRSYDSQGSDEPGRVTCFACRESPAFKAAQLRGVGTPTLIHFISGSLIPACADGTGDPLLSSLPGEVTCFRCRRSAEFKMAQIMGVATPTPLPQRQTPRLLREIIAESAELRDIIKAGLNSGTGDGQWAALTDLADHFGLTYDEDTDTYT